MADEKTETKVEEKKEVKKLDDVKDSLENKAAIAESEGKIVTESVKVEEKAVVKEEKAVVKEEKAVVKEEKVKKDKKKGEVVELEREYVVPLRRGFLNVPHYKRAKKAIKVLKEFMVRHMNIRDGDLGKVKIDMYLNNEIWFRGIKKPLSKVKVKAKKISGIVYVELAEIPEAVGFKIAREAKRVAAVSAVKPKKAKKADASQGDGKRVTGDGSADKDKDGVDDKKEEAEDKKAGAEKAAKTAKVKAGVEKHTAQGKHMKKVQPVRKALKK